MAKVNICNVEVVDNPAAFLDPFKFKITFECHEPLDDDLEWKLTYVSSAYQVNLDQTLDSVLVGPIPVGRHQFVFETSPPDTSKIPAEDAVGVTVVLIQCLYREKEFIRVGYYVNNEYAQEEMKENPPTEPLYDELQRNILASDPRVTRFPIDWGDGLVTSSGPGGEVAGSNGGSNQLECLAPLDDVMLRKEKPPTAAAGDQSSTADLPCNGGSPPPALNGNAH